MTFFPGDSVVVSIGEVESQGIKIVGDGYSFPDQTKPNVTGLYKISPSIKCTKESVEDVKKEKGFVIYKECSCFKNRALEISSPNNTSRQTFTAKFLQKNFLNNEFEENEDDDILEIEKLLKTFEKFSHRKLKSYQSRSLLRLARSYKGKEILNTSLCASINKLLEFDLSPDSQQATLVLLSQLFAYEANVEFVFRHYQSIVDHVLLLASDPSTLQVQLSSFDVICQLTCYRKYVSEWDCKLEDIVYPLLHSILKSSSTSEEQKTASVAIVKNLATFHFPEARVKQDLLSYLLIPSNSTQIKASVSEALYQNLQSSKQRVSSDILEDSLLPVLSSMLEDGPCESQRQALKLFFCIADDEVSRVTLFTNNNCITLCVLCVKHSQCRKTRAVACEVLSKLLNLKETSEAKQFMECCADASKLEVLTPSSMIAYPQKIKKNSTREKLWKHFDELIDCLVSLLESEGCMTIVEEQLVCELSFTETTSREQLASISSIVACFNSLCLWPLHRPGARHTLTNQSDNHDLSSDILKMVLAAINNKKTLEVWDSVGPTVMTIFRQLLKGICPGSQSRESKKHDENPDLFPSSLDKLLNCLLDFLFLMSVASCYFGSSASSNSNKTSESPKRTTSKKAELAEKEACAERRILRQGLVDHGVMFIMSKLLNLHDSHIQATSTLILRLCLQPVQEPSLKSVTRSPAVNSLSVPSKKERPQTASGKVGTPLITETPTVSKTPALKPRLRPRSAMPRISGTQGSMGVPAPYLLKSDTSEATDINKRRKPYIFSSFVTSSNLRNRPVSAYSPLSTRSSRKPLFSRAGERVDGIFKKSEIEQSNQKRANKDWRANGSSADDQRKRHARFHEGASTWTLDDKNVFLSSAVQGGKTINRQCCERALLATGYAPLKGLFSSSEDVKRSSLLFLHDLVLNSDNDVHMELSRMGCVQKLIDFLRLNEDEELLEITGLTIARMLVSSDRRICQLFQRHGGSNLLMALLQKKQSPKLKEELGLTLSTVNSILQPSEESQPNNHPADIWEHILQRWQNEDKVVTVLQQFTGKHSK